MSSIDKRLSALESRVSSGEIAQLEMPDGSRQTVRLKPGQDVLDLFTFCLKNPDSAEARAIAAAVNISEPDGHMLEAVAALLNSPVETEPEAKGMLIQ